MPRIRSIKPEFWTSEDVAECSPIARLLFVGLWTHCDDGGIHPAKPKRVKMEVFPADSFTPEQILEWIEELKQATLLEEYEVDGKSYWRVSGWHHQRIERPSYRFPLPNGKANNSASVRRSCDDSSPSDRRQLIDGHPPEKDREKEIKKTSKEKPKPAFQKPTGEQVSEYAESIDFKLDGSTFVDYYQSAGWTIGRNKPMRDWKAAVRTWKKNHEAKNPPAASKIATEEDLANWSPTG